MLLLLLWLAAGPPVGRRCRVVVVVVVVGRRAGSRGAVFGWGCGGCGGFLDGGAVVGVVFWLLFGGAGAGGQRVGVAAVARVVWLEGLVFGLGRVMGWF